MQTITRIENRTHSDYDEQDEYCPHCDNKYVREAVVPTPELSIETDDPRINAAFIRDSRIKSQRHQHMQQNASCGGDGSTDLTPFEYERLMREKLLSEINDAELFGPDI